MTAEGDNSVLMQKVVKDILVHTQKDKHSVPKVSKDAIGKIKSSRNLVEGFTSLKNLVYLREQIEIKEMVKILQDSIMKKKKKFFDIWMAELNDEIQSLASSFGERYML